MDLLQIVSKINSSLSDYVLITLLAGAGIYFTLRTGFVQLRCFGERSFRQIGTIFGKTENWARVTYHRARLKIQERMD